MNNEFLLSIRTKTSECPCTVQWCVQGFLTPFPCRHKTLKKGIFQSSITLTALLKCLWRSCNFTYCSALLLCWHQAQDSLLGLSICTASQAKLTSEHFMKMLILLCYLTRRMWSRSQLDFDIPVLVGQCLWLHRAWWSSSPQHCYSDVIEKRSFYIAIAAALTSSPAKWRNKEEY